MPLASDVEVDAAVIVIEEEGVVERGRLAAVPQYLVVAERAVQDQVGENRLLLLPPRLAVVPDEAMDAPAGLALRSTTSYQPPRCWSLPTSGIISAILRPAATYFSCRLERAAYASGSRRSSGCGRPPRGSAASPTSGRGSSPRRTSPARTGCCRSPGSAPRSCRTVSSRKSHVPLLAGRQVQVDQVRRGVVADRVPVLACPVRAERIGARVERHRVDVREVAAVLPGPRSTARTADRCLRCRPDRWIAGGAVGLSRAGQGVDLLVAGIDVDSRRRIPR